MFGTNGGGKLDVDPTLGASGHRDRSTATLLLGACSSAIDAGNTTTCRDPNTLDKDQRGVTRPQGVACDIGADDLFVDGRRAMP